MIIIDWYYTCNCNEKQLEVYDNLDDNIGSGGDDYSVYDNVKTVGECDSEFQKNFNKFLKGQDM